MAQLRESTTIGGSIAITAKNIHEYLDNVVIEGVGGGLELNKHTFEEYVKIHNITDLDQLSTANDTGLYLTTGGITNPPVALYGSITLPPILTGTYWKPKMFEVDTSYFLTKSPMSDASIILIFNRSNKPTTKDMIILCYHLKTNVWYQMEQNSSTGKFSKKWEVKKEIEREFRAFDKVDGALKDLSNNLAQTDKNVGVHGTRLTKVEALAVENKNETVAIRKDVVPKSDIVQTIGTSTSRVMSQKAIRDYTDSVGDANGKFMREGAFGLGSNGDHLGQDGATIYKPNGFYRIGGSDLGYPDYKRSGDASIVTSWTDNYYSELFFGQTAQRYAIKTVSNGKDLGWAEIFHDKNTTTDKNNVLYSGTSKPLDSLNTSNIVTTTGSSTVNAMSQKTVTDELNSLKKDVDKKRDISDMSFSLGETHKETLYLQNAGNRSGAIGYYLKDSKNQTVSMYSVEKGSDNKTFMLMNHYTDGVYKGQSRVALVEEVDTKITGGTIVQTTGTSTTNVPSQKVFTDEINKKLTAGVLTNVEGTSTTNVMSQKGVTDGLNKRITGGSVQQAEGTSTVNVMSQKATTDALNKRITGGSVQQGVGSSTVNVMSQNAVDTHYTRNHVISGTHVVDFTKNEGILVTNSVIAKDANLPTTNWKNAIVVGQARNKRSALLMDDNTNDSWIWSQGTGNYEKILYESNGIMDHGALGTKNLDTVTQFGMHHQTANTNATTARKYPVALAGTLWVLPSAGVTQIYITYNQGQRIYTRNNYGGKWDAWVENLDTSDIVNALGTATNKVVSQKVVNDVDGRVNTTNQALNNWTTKLTNEKMDKAQNLKDLTNVTTARTNLGLGNSAIRNLTTAQGTSTVLVATQKLVNDVKAELNTEIGKKLTAGNLVQTTGTSTTNVMSQKAVTDAVNASVGMGLGYGQKYKRYTFGGEGSGMERENNKNYKNTTGKPILWITRARDINIYVDDLLLGGQGANDRQERSVVVPPNSTYRVEARVDRMYDWWELR